MPTPKKKQYSIGRSSTGFDLELPSGNLALVRRPGAQGLIKQGLLDSLDTLTALVKTEHIDSKDPKKMVEAAKRLTVDKGNREAIVQGIELMDRVICAVVIEPKVLPVPALETERDPEALYVDDVDPEDKSFIFNFVVGGTRDIETFRKEHSQLMGNISDVQGDALPA